MEMEHGSLHAGCIPATTQKHIGVWLNHLPANVTATAPTYDHRIHTKAMRLQCSCRLGSRNTLKICGNFACMADAQLDARMLPNRPVIRLHTETSEHEAFSAELQSSCRCGEGGAKQILPFQIQGKGRGRGTGTGTDLPVSYAGDLSPLCTASQSFTSSCWTASLASRLSST